MTLKNKHLLKELSLGHLDDALGKAARALALPITRTDQRLLEEILEALPEWAVWALEVDRVLNTIADAVDEVVEDK